jgi:hypothetical protein
MTAIARRSRLPLGLLAAVVAGCAGNQPPPELVDPIIIPELAVEVDKVALFNGEDWTPLNRRMVVVYSGRTPYLLVFNTPCPGLKSTRPLAVHMTDSTLYARFDSVISEHGTRCRIDRMYAITREDVPALRDALKR